MYLQRGLIRALVSRAVTAPLSSAAAVPLVHVLRAQVQLIGTDGEPLRRRLGRRGVAFVLQGLRLRGEVRATR